MLSHWSHVRTTLFGGLLAALAGCIAPPPPRPTQELSTDNLLKLATATADYSTLEWSPRTGRMDEATQNRHIQPDASRSLLWLDNFDGPEPALPLGWKQVGPAAPQLHRFRIDAHAGLDISAPPEGAGEIILERRLPPDQLYGRDVLLSVTLACPSVRRLDALREVRLSVVSTNAAGRPKEVFLPIAVDVAPGWERLDWWLRFGPDVGPTALRLHLLRPGAGILLASTRMSARDWLTPASNAVPTTAPASQPSRRVVNLVAGGSFETGKRTFFASTIGSWADREPNPSLLPFDYDTDAAVGQQSLRLPIAQGTARLGFGPLNLAEHMADPGTMTWHLRFHAKAARNTTATVSLRTVDRTLGETTFALRTEWQTLAHALRIAAQSQQEVAELAAAELIIDVACDSPEPLDCWIDGVSLTDEPTETYIQAEPVEVGITGPAPLSADLANVVTFDEPEPFLIQLIADASQPQPGTAAPAGGAVGTLTVDLLDAWDRSVWNRTSQPVLTGDGRYDETVNLRLPRGYFRLLATLWSGEPGRSRVISQDSQSVAAISFDDAVPLGNRYGLTAAGQTVSGYTTALGAGWVRMNLPAARVEVKPGVSELTLWQPGFAAVKQAGLELVTAITLPTIDRFRRPFVEQLLASMPVQPIGVVVNPPAISTRPADEYREQLEWVGQAVSAVSPHGRVVFDLSALDGAGSPAGGTTGNWPAVANLVVGYASMEGRLPEQSEPLLAGIGQRYSNELRVWDLGVPVRLSGNCLGANCMPLAPVHATDDEPVSRIEVVGDPEMAASRMVRSILIRALAGAQLVCAEAVALDPLLSVHEPGRDRLHEADLSPRPAVVAFERMTSLLNDATLVRWIDQPDTTRILYFEKDSGGAVAVLWRPFGLSPTYLSFAGLPSTIDVLDCFGMPEPIVMSGNIRLVAANAFVRYIVATPDQRALLAEAVASARIRPGPAAP